MLESEYTIEGVLGAVTRAIVPAFGDWAVADYFADGVFQRKALSHRDHGLSALLGDSQRNRRLYIPEGHPLHDALMERLPRVFSAVSESDCAPLLLNCSDVADIRPAHLLFIPLTARNRLLGALTLVSTRADRPFSAADVYVARDLALRVGAALDNLRLYHAALGKVAETARREQIIVTEKNLLEQLRTELEAVNARLEVEATTDGLTGLLNHLTFKRSLDESFALARETGAPLSVMLLDVDRFKSYNDSFGHPAGDDVLRRVAKILQECTRGTDCVARYGGEEFVVVMPHTDAMGALEVTERVRQGIEKDAWPHRAVTASFGVATLHADTDSPRELVSAADEALYRSKQAGRNRMSHADVAGQAVTLRWPGVPTPDFAA